MKKLLSFIAVILFAATSFAQVNEVTLTTIGNGRTEDEATLRALRNALEQTFGTFVSANTAIINDELVRDEIAATSKGNVKSYQKLSVVKLPDRTTTVTLKATVSINKLISYARNNGSRAEFAGQTYAMNVKLLKLQQQNANKTLDVMRDNVISLCHGVFDYDIKLGEVRKEKIYNIGNDNVEYKYVLPFSLDVYATDVTSNIHSLITETFDAIRLTPTMKEDFKKNNLIYYGDFPVSESRINEICDAIVLAIMDDFWTVRIKKINDNEYFSLKRYDRNSTIYSSSRYESDLYREGYRWLYSNKQPSTIINYINSARSTPRNAIEFNVANQRMRNHNGIPGLIIISDILVRTTSNSFSKWNTNVNGQIYQQKLASYSLCILLTDEELERFQGLELVGVTSPKHTSVPKPDKKKEAIKGYKKMSDLPLKSPVQISQIRVLTTNLPKKTYSISMTCKGPNGLQTFEIKIGANKQECKYWEWNGDAFASAFPNAIERTKGDGYISFDLIKDNYTIKKFPKELSDFVYVR